MAWKWGIIPSSANPPFKVTNEFIHKIWQNYPTNKVEYDKKGIFLFRFVNMGDEKAVLQKDAYLLDKKLVLGVTKDLVIYPNAIKSFPIWVQFPKLDIKYLSIDSLSQLESFIGIPININKPMMEKTMPYYASHEESECRKKNVVRKECRVVNNATVN
ncbi:LOW QUALITY PROTEIN: hypothetical protein Cgig2_026135 [Carnegiea gigantea]|uniref:DUF4283 domain-containing protein n=1 Tax=Carnegiea gigantea TaxID=171969 RepID=A0A9Q1JXQ8_9CARY|nr:LOW QUALITY PROTEIN: hypothetical protein Cgig2_026135 [Carnegiea gigantea]